MRVLKHKLSNFCEFKSGIGFPIDYQGQTKGAYPFIKVSDMITPGNELKIHSANNWIEQNMVKKFKSGIVPANSIVFAKIGIALYKNRIRITTIPTIIDNNMMAAIPKKGVSIEQLFAIFTTIEFQTWALGAALPYLRRGDLEEIDLSYINFNAIGHWSMILNKLNAIQDVENFKLEKMNELCSNIFVRNFCNIPVKKLPTNWNIGKLSDIVTLDKKTFVPSQNLTENVLHYSIPEFDSTETPKLSLGSDINSSKLLISKDCVLLSKLNPRIQRVLDS